MTKYLYGASVQGIQDFIFETNKLKEIVGASEIVEQLCDRKNFCKELKIAEESVDFILAAAGNIRLLADQNIAEKIVLKWPKIVAEIAPGVTLSQAVVVCENDNPTKDLMNELEKKLKIQRNKASMPNELAPMAAIRSRRTGKPAVDWKDENKAPRDFGTKTKQKAGKKDAKNSLLNKIISDYSKERDNKLYPFDVEDICRENHSDWLAVIHADGNGLGKIIQGLSDNLEKNSSSAKLQDAFTKFSKAIDDSTREAAQEAIKKTGTVAYENEKLEKYPFRPVVLGGDDLTIIIRGDLAIQFTMEFLKNFEEKTKKNLAPIIKEFQINLEKNYLTACAGIAFMKPSFPFHYAYHLAEELCGNAKKELKRETGFSFHKIQDSFVETYEDIIKRELTPQKEISFKYGPYDIKKAEELLNWVKEINEKDAPKSGIRKWLSLLHKDKHEADLWIERVIEITKEKNEKYINLLELSQAIKDNKTHLYDVMSVASIVKGGK